HDFVEKDLHDLARPEKLVLEVDEAVRRAKCAHVRLEDSEIAVPNRSVDVLGHGSNCLHLDVTGRWAWARLGKRVAGEVVPPLGEVGGDVRHHGTSKQACGVMPAE